MVGIDEVGRGSLAGPLLVVAARQFDQLPPGVTDSKLLTRQLREELFEALVAACRFGEGWVSSVEIDRRGLTGAMRLGVKRSLRSLEVSWDEDIIMDGPYNYLGRSFKRVQCLVDADAQVPLVSAASIYAKVRRDRLMIELARDYPAYGFENHVGYGTPAHRLALADHGPIAGLHRQLFAPVRLLQEQLL